MDIVTAGRACLRRWWVFVPALVIAVFAVLAYAGNEQTTYSVSGSIYILPDSVQPVVPKTGPTVTVNPFKAAGSGFAGSALAASLNSAETRTAVRESVPGAAPYGVQNPKTSPGLLVIAQSSDPVAATATVQAVIARADAELRRLQLAVGAPKDELFRAETLTPVGQPVASASRRTKLLLAGGVLGLAATIAFTVLVDTALLALGRARARRRQAALATGGHTAAEPVPTTGDRAGRAPRPAKPARSAAPGRTRRPRGTAPSAGAREPGVAPSPSPASAPPQPVPALVARDAGQVGPSAPDHPVPGPVDGAGLPGSTTAAALRPAPTTTVPSWVAPTSPPSPATLLGRTVPGSATRPDHQGVPASGRDGAPNGPVPSAAAPGAGTPAGRVPRTNGAAPHAVPGAPPTDGATAPGRPAHGTVAGNGVAATHPDGTVEHPAGGDHRAPAVVSAATHHVAAPGPVVETEPARDAETEPARDAEPRSSRPSRHATPSRSSRPSPRPHRPSRRPHRPHRPT